ncbi:P-type DNA transfer ATPase VirB11 [Tatlockia micdadei]|uniref:P-type DNA transfer ATPase VirB11 n=1 Tax=Legionella micdadei TaxID=451 RepID=UPI00156F8749|nr:P-type DNA transfer ATPase VirB11 [Legionella micdadei]NSL19588.1 P-type DNA transfer ATPase VirB11 [Legionella micdadei]
MTENKAFFAPGSQGLLKPLEPWLTDKQVSEILINQPGEVFIERLGEMHRFELPVLDCLHLKRLFTLIANENSQVINESWPLLSGNLRDGSRVQLVIPPAAKEMTLSIRRQSIASHSLADYEAASFFSKAKPFSLSKENDLLSENDHQLLKLYHQQQWGEFIALAILAKKTIVISGETSSGKTTFLNACCHHIPKHERLITLEDTFEINLPHLNKVSLLAPKLREGAAAVTMQDLVQCSLRLRPERLIMGEIRGREILDFINACATGHEGSLTSIHASNPQVAFMRMTQLYKLNNVPSMRDKDILRELNEVIDIIVQLKKTPAGRVVTWVYFKLASYKNTATQ